MIRLTVILAISPLCFHENTAAPSLVDLRQLLSSSVCGTEHAWAPRGRREVNAAL